jgi:subtilisin family serine protease
MRWIIGLLALGLASTAGAVGNIVSDEELPGAPALNRWIVGFYVDPPYAVGDAYLGQAVVMVDLDLDFIVVEVGDLAAFTDQANQDPAVKYLEWDNPFYATLDFVPNDPKYSDAGHWGSKKIGAETAWDKTKGATSVKVAMIDSGLYKGHEEFSGQSRVLQGWDFVSEDNNPQDTSGCSWHGTHTTGTAGATINNNKGIAGMSQHSILPIRAFYSAWFGCTATTTDLEQSLKYAGDQGAHISSNSWGGGSSTTLNNAIQYAHDKGTIHVAAAGNSGPCTNCISQPWKAKHTIVVVVTSTTSTDGFSSFSSEGSESDVSAPGSSIISSVGPNANSYGTYSGTSMATPHVAGTAALIKALNPSMGFTSMESRLKTTALDLGASGEDDKFGAGRIRADQAVY